MTTGPAASPTPEPSPGSPTGPRLIGRDAEIARLDSLLSPDGPAVINVTGPRGAGKSAIIDAALHVAAARFGVTHHLDLGGESAEEALPALQGRIARLPIPLRSRERGPLGRRSLLVVDRGDALVPVADQAAELAIADGALTVIVESVPQLHTARGETIAVGPLDGAAGAELFRRAAAAVGVRLDTGPMTSELIARICSWVDGNPLAIELAAQRLPFIPLPALDELLSSPQRALAALTAPIGSGSAHGAILSSQRASSAGAQMLLDLLSVFAGSFTIEAAEAVSQGVVTPCFDAMAELIDQRLVELEPDAHGGRYRLSRLVRGFAAARLETSGHSDEAHARHARHFAGVARRAAIAIEDADENAARAEMGGDYGECLAALKWLSAHEPAAAMRLAADLAWEAQRRGTVAVLARSLAHLAATVPDGAPADRRDALIQLVQLDSWAPDAHDRATAIAARLDEALALARDIGDPLPLLLALRAQYMAFTALGDVAAALAACDEGIRRALAIGHTRWAGRFEISLAALQGNLRRYDAALEAVTSGLARAIRSDDRLTVIHATLIFHGLPSDVASRAHDVPSLEGILEIARALEDVQRESHVLAALALTAIDRGDLPTAATWIAARQGILGRLDLINGLTVSVMLAVQLAAVRGDAYAGARLHGAIAAYAETVLPVMSPEHAARYRSRLERLAELIGQERFDAAVQQGRAWGRAETLAALTDLLQHTETPAPADHSRSPAAESGTLTPRERQVLELVARGRQNKEIAAELHMTPKSVMHHTVAIYRKLGVRGRAEAATTAARLGLVSLE